MPPSLSDDTETDLVPSLDDETRDRFARLVRTRLGAAVAMVSLDAASDRSQTTTWALPAGWDTDTVPFLGDSFRSVLLSRGMPLVVPDVAADTRLRDQLTGPDARVASYIGFPLGEPGETPVGVLCAMDAVPREWADDDLDFLEDLAAICSSELRLRAEHARAREIQRMMTQNSRKNRLLLLLSDAFADAVTIEDVAETAGRVAMTGLGVRHTSLALLSEDRQTLRYTVDNEYFGSLDQKWIEAAIDDDRPISHVARTRQTALFRDFAHMASEFPSIAAADPGNGGGRALLPLVSSGELLGVLALVWDMPRQFDEQSAPIKAALAGYTAQALDRARLLAERQSVSQRLQSAMLTPLPAVDGLQLSSVYEPAARGEQVGGDWYDAVPLHDGSLALMIGDVTGHDLEATILMGQLRSMLRAFAWEHDEPPSAVLSLLDRANQGIGLNATGTGITTRLCRTDEGSYTVQWSSAGHPPPAILRAGGSVEVLRARNDLMLGVHPGITRHDHAALLHPGDTLVLYTDGLIERRGETILDGLDRLSEVLERRAGDDFGVLGRSLLDDMVGGVLDDDTALLLARVV